MSTNYNNTLCAYTQANTISSNAPVDSWSYQSSYDLGSHLNLLNSSSGPYPTFGSPQNGYSYMLNSHESQLFGAPMRGHDYGTPLNNPSPPLSREYSMLQTHSPIADENSIGTKIEYVNVNHTLNASPERYGGMSPKYEANLLHEVKQDYDGRIGEQIKTEAGSNQTYVTLPPFLN